MRLWGNKTHPVRRSLRIVIRQVYLFERKWWRKIEKRVWFLSNDHYRIAVSSLPARLAYFVVYVVGYDLVPHHLYAAAAATIMYWVLYYWLVNGWVFKGNGSARKEGLAFLVFQATLTGLNFLFLDLLIGLLEPYEQLPWPELFSWAPGWVQEKWVEITAASVSSAVYGVFNLLGTEKIFKGTRTN